MRLLVSDIDDLHLTPRDLSDLAFEGSPERVELTVDGGDPVARTPVRSATLDRPAGSTSTDERYDLSDLVPPCEAVAEWDGGRATLHVVSAHYCTVADVLDYGDEKRQSPRQLHRTEADAFRARDEAETVCDDLCGHPFRATRVTERTFTGNGGLHQLAMPATRILTPGWEPVGDGLVRAPSGPDPRTGYASVEYVSGDGARVPADVRRAVARLAASYLTVSKVPDRAVYESTDAGMTRYTLASSESTGIPDVDAVFSRHARKRWAVL